MREFKFRSWDKDFLTMHFFLEKSHNLPTPQPLHKYFELKERFEIMQYVGLKDCKGKEIYEGDIIIYDKIKGMSRIRFEKGSFFFYGMATTQFLWNIEEKEIEVIGNIYENPELL